MSIELLQENPEIAKAIKDMIKEASNVPRSRSIRVR